MRRRLYFILPDLTSANHVADELLLARIEDRHMHFLAKRGTPLGKLHEAGYQHKSDLFHGASVGLVVGAVMGFLIGAGLYLMQPEGFNLRPVFILGAILFFGAFGAWASSMVGVSTPNSQLRQFEDEIEQGKILLILDIPKDRIQEISALLPGRHPEVSSRGFEPTVPAFP